MADSKKNKAKGLTGQDLKDFRHSVAILFKKGLVKKKAREQKPTRYMRAKIKSLSDIIEGRQVAVKVSRDVLKKAKAENQRIVAGRVLAPAGQPKMAAAIRKGNFIEKVEAVGTTGRGWKREIDLSRFFSLEEFLNTYEDHPHDLDKLKPKNWSFAFTYFGNRTRMTFEDAEMLLINIQYYLQTTLPSYNIGDDSFSSQEAETLSEVWEGFSLFTIEQDERWERETNAIIRDRQKRSRKAYERRLMRKNPEYALKKLDREAEKKKKKRARMNDAQREAYKLKARERAKKSYEARKIKK